MQNFLLPEWTTHCKLIQSVDELPQWYDNKYLYLDFETTSGNEKEVSTNPWRNCKLLGIAVLVDEEDTPIYIPLRHENKSTYHNLPVNEVADWLENVVRSSTFWVNHNVKYDAHVLLNDLEIDYRTHNVRLIDTLMLCRMAPRLERLTYNLTDIMNEWCYTQIQHYEDRIKLYLKQYKSKDYAVIPIDVMTPYACVDTLSVRKLFKQLCEEIPEESQQITNIERQVTGILFDIERNGMRVNQEILELHKQYLSAQMDILSLQVTLESGIPGWQLHTNSFGKAFFLDKEGLPTLSFTEKGGTPSFDNDTLLAYKARYPKYESIIDKVIEYREIKKLFTSFTLPYLELNVDGIIHPSYNQIVRTGRMSCRTPNMQQLSPEAREYIIPYDLGSVIVDIDFCVTGDTLIITPYGNKSMSEVCEKMLPVLGLSNDCELLFCDITKAAKVGMAPCYKITFEDSSSIECTGEHGFEDYKERKRIDCKDIKPGMRLAHVKEDIDAFGYPRWYIFTNRNYYKKHKLVGDYLYTRGSFDSQIIYHYHHINGDKECWTTDNIEIVDAKIHKSRHAKENFKNQDHEYRIEKLREGIKRRIRYNGANNPNYRGAGQKRTCENCGGEFIAYPSQEARGIKKYCCVECRNEHTGSNFNHRVVKVEYVGEKEVYTLTNPVTHNYVSANGLVNLNSQIEFRLIAHFIQNPVIIKAYNDDPATDYHVKVAEMCSIARKPAKTVNFMAGYGAGVKKCVQVLSSIPDVIGNLKDRHAIQLKAETVLKNYHRMVPELKSTQYRAMNTCKIRGFVRTIMGRRRYLPPVAYFAAFNTVCQGSAADIYKAALIRIADHIKDKPHIKLLGCVHDSVIFNMPKEAVERETPILCNIFSEIPEGIKLRVPMAANAKWSSKNWGVCE